MRRKRLLVYLMGGLGNQLFQFAAGKAISSVLNVDLMMASNHGFRYDPFGLRQFELSPFALPYSHLTRPQELPAFLYQIANKYRLTPSLRSLRPWISWLTDQDLDPMDICGSVPQARNIWMLGYWQNPAIWQSYSDDIYNDLRLPSIDSPQISDLVSEIQESKTLSVGLRLYEEIPDKTLHESRISLKYAKRVSMALDETCSRTGADKLLVFSTRRHPFLNLIDWPLQPVFLTPDTGVARALDVLAVMQASPFHLVTGSTLYWWGAWLSWNRQARPDEHIFYLNDFPTETMRKTEWTCLEE